MAAPTNFTATAGDAQVMLSWDAPETGSGVTKHQYRQKTTGSYGNWTDIPNSAEDGANDAGFTVTTNIVNDGLHLRRTPPTYMVPWSCAR